LKGLTVLVTYCTSAKLAFRGKGVKGPRQGVRRGPVSRSDVPGDDSHRGEGSKPLVTPMHPAFKELLFGFTLEHTDMKGQSPLLRQPRKKQSCSVGRPYTRRMIERLTHQWDERAQVPTCLPHRFRHTFATDLLRAPLNHADLGTTAIYTKVVDAQTGEAVFRLPSTWNQESQ
jgi:integrase